MKVLYGGHKQREALQTKENKCRYCDRIQLVKISYVQYMEKEELDEL